MESKGTTYTLVRSSHWQHIFQRSKTITRFPALSNGYMFSRAFRLIHVSRAFQKLHGYLRVVPVTSFPTLYITCHMLHVFANLCEIRSYWLNT